MRASPASLKRRAASRASALSTVSSVSTLSIRTVRLNVAPADQARLPSLPLAWVDADGLHWPRW
ncbi:MAG: hypothetical protein JWP72_2671 [Massilia sp.]|nr:hypothetical protein [Massilia sp.]